MFEKKISREEKEEPLEKRKTSGNKGKREREREKNNETLVPEQ